MIQGFFITAFQKKEVDRREVKQGPKSQRVIRKAGNSLHVCLIAKFTLRTNGKVVLKSPVLSVVFKIVTLTYI